MNNYVIDPFIYNPPNIDPRERFNIIEFEDIARGRYLISIYGRVYDALYNAFLVKKRIKNRTWSGSIFFENYCLFDTIDNAQTYKCIPLIILSSFVDYKPDYRIIHINSDTLDDNLYNLRYGDYIDIPDKIYIRNIATTKKKVVNGKKQTRVSDESIEMVCKLLEKNIHPSLISEMTGISWRDVYNIKTFRLGVDISKNYTFKPSRGGIYDYEYYNKVVEELGL